MAAGIRRPNTAPQAPRIPRGFDSSDPERRGEVVPRQDPTAPAEGEGHGRRSPEVDDEGSRRRRPA